MVTVGDVTAVADVVTSTRPLFDLFPFSLLMARPARSDRSHPAGLGSRGRVHPERHQRSADELGVLGLLAPASARASNGPSPDAGAGHDRSPGRRSARRDGLMSPPSLEARFAAPGPKRILSLDGGGIRGVLTLQYLARIESILGERSPDPGAFRLSDYFDLIGGTSTGSIIATGLALGFPLRDCRSLHERSRPPFSRSRRTGSASSCPNSPGLRWSTR